MKKSTIAILIFGIVSIIVILGYSTYKSLEDAVDRKTSTYDDLTNMNNDSSSTSSVRKISDELKKELIQVVPLYSNGDAYQKKSSTTKDSKEAMLFMAFKYVKEKGLYNTQNITLRNMCAGKYGNGSRCVMFISNENLNNYLTKYYNTLVTDLNIDSITFTDTSEVLEKLDDEYYAVLTNEIKHNVVKIPVSSKTYNFDDNIIIEEVCLFTMEDNNGYHGLYKSSKLDEDSKLDDSDISIDGIDTIVKKYKAKANKYEHTFIKVDTDYIWTKTILK